LTAGIERAIVRAPEGDGWWEFATPVQRFAASRADEVPRLLEQAEEATRAGLWAVGFVAYEAAPAFDPALATRPPELAPMAACSTFPSPRPLSFGTVASGTANLEALVPAMDASAHAAAVAAIREAIAAGETYQINLTFPMRSRLDGTPEALFARLARASRAPYAALLDLGERTIVSLSPELFFDLEGERIAMRPMKGTRRRGRFAAEDEARAAELAASPKDRAENLMIVDMARNDLGRIARPGSVEVTRLCEVERYPTVWQLTTTIEAESVAPLADIFGALFPCASVTGAPKPRSMRWIERLEPSPRGVYCGAIGWAAPARRPEERRARFSVAIRTATVEKGSGALAYGVGSGIVWDSEPAAEYDECLAKAKALEDPGSPLALLETMRWKPRRGIRFLDRHLARLAESAGYFDIAFGEGRVREAIATTLSRLPPVAHRIRLQLDSDGQPSLTSKPLGAERSFWRAVLAVEPIDSSSPLLFHKTIRREIYDRALAEAESRGADETILWNERGELTEGSRTNLVLRIGGRWFTPARECGLLAGVLRGWLLDRGWVREAVLPKEALARAERVVLVSSLRGVIAVELG
jgi:para-aminobenzoate synthetase/4-amino-4-deoxychorismate lyase